MPRQRFSAPVEAVFTSFAFVAVLFVIQFVNPLFRGSLLQFGIVPRTASGLWGILWSPLLHLNLAHLTTNAVPLFMLLVLLLSNPRCRPYRALALIWAFSGFGTWLIGRGQSVHIGASSLVFGLAAFLIVAGIVMKSWLSAAIAIGVLVAFGGIFYGVLPRAGAISWEAHLCGAAAGALTAVRTPRTR